MAHLSIEYSANLAVEIDMAKFCECARLAMAKSKVFPLAGIRVRAFEADHCAVGNGDEDLGFIDMVLRQGPGRTDAQKMQSLNTIYDACEKLVKQSVSLPVALSLELVEINYPFAEKRLNTIRTALKDRGEDNA